VIITLIDNYTVHIGVLDVYGKKLEVKRRKRKYFRLSVGRDDRLGMQ